MSQTDLEHWLANRRRQTTVRLQQEVRALPTLDPGTDRSDDTDIWLAVARAQNAIMGILGMSDDDSGDDVLMMLNYADAIEAAKAAIAKAKGR